MTQSQVVDHLAEETGLSRAQVRDLFDKLYTLAAREIKANGEFSLPGLGTFFSSQRKRRWGRNPTTGETIQIPAKKTLKFRVGKDVKKGHLGDPYTDP